MLARYFNEFFSFIKVIEAHYLKSQIVLKSFLTKYRSPLLSPPCLLPIFLLESITVTLLAAASNMPYLLSP